MSAVLVTGGAGFIGSHVSERLLGRGERVLCYDNFDDFYDPAIKRANVAPLLGRPGFELLCADLRDPRALAEALSGQAGGVGRPDRVVHLAARAGVRPSLRDPALYADVNVRGTALLLEACRAAGVAKVVFASSSSVYGGSESAPFREEDPADRPLSPYAATKRAGELLASVYATLHGFDITCLRFFTAYGPRQRPEMAIHKFARLIEAGEPLPIFGDGTSRRDYTYIDDIVEGTVAALDRLGGFRLYNLGESRTVELLDLVRLLGEALGRPVRLEHRPVEPGDAPLTYADVSRARAELGYDPAVPLEEGIARFVAWFRRGRPGPGGP